MAINITLSELNEIKNIHKQITAEKKKLKALKIVLGAFPHKYGKSNEDGRASSGVAKTTFENFIIQIADCEKRIEKLQIELLESIPKLAQKIQDNFFTTGEQNFLIYRFVACKHFREISFLMGYSERRVYQIYEKILQKYFS